MMSKSLSTRFKELQLEKKLESQMEPEFIESLRIFIRSLKFNNLNYNIINNLILI